MHPNPKILPLCNPTPSEAHCTVASTSEILTALLNAPLHYKQPSIAQLEARSPHDVSAVLAMRLNISHTLLFGHILEFFHIEIGLLHTLAAMLVSPFHLLSLTRACGLVGCFCDLPVF